MKKLLISAAALMLPAVAFAHPGHDAAGFTSGFSHPFTGLDHLLAMVAVGLFAARQSGAARWATPVAFVLMMGVGAVVGTTHLQIPFVELMIAASVVVFGALVALNFKLQMKNSALAGAALAGVFAFFHGFAHGAEMPAMAVLATYGAGFMLATAVLHATGYLLAAYGSNKAAEFSRRAAGGAIALAGVALGVA